MEEAVEWERFGIRRPGDLRSNQVRGWETGAQQGPEKNSGPAGQLSRDGSQRRAAARPYQSEAKGGRSRLGQPSRSTTVGRISGASNMRFYQTNPIFLDDVFHVIT